MPIDEQQITQHVRTLLRNMLHSKGDNEDFSDDESLVISGRIDSLRVVELAAELEETYQLNFADHGFNQYDFDSVNSIVDLILKQTSNQ